MYSTKSKSSKLKFHPSTRVPPQSLHVYIQADKRWQETSKRASSSSPQRRGTYEIELPASTRAHLLLAHHAGCVRSLASNAESRLSYSEHRDKGGAAVIRSLARARPRSHQQLDSAASRPELGAALLSDPACGSSHWWVVPYKGFSAFRLCVKLRRLCAVEYEELDWLLGVWLRVCVWGKSFS